MLRGTVLALTVCYALTQAGVVAAQELHEPSAPARLELQEPNLLVPSLHASALMLSMRIGEAYIWPDPFADPPRDWGAHYEAAFTQPPKWDSQARAFEWDGDPWYINVIGHGLFGSELYLRARHCHLGVAGSLVFTAASSAAWEYGFEANGVRPSGFDLWFTPLAGLVLGEGRYWAWRAADSVGQNTVRGLLKGILDPFGELERAAGAPC